MPAKIKAHFLFNLEMSMLEVISVNRIIIGNN